MSKWSFRIDDQREFLGAIGQSATVTDSLGWLAPTVSALPRVERAVVELVYTRRHTQREVAELLDLPTQVVAEAMRRALASIAAAVET